MAPLQAQAFTIDNSSPRLSPDLQITAKRYTTAHSAQNRDGLTLLFTHCIGSRMNYLILLVQLTNTNSRKDKEQWEPTIQRLFDTQQCKDKVHRIREAWSFDRQNHGDAAILNREALRNRREGVCGFNDYVSALSSNYMTAVFEWTPAIASFIRSPRMKGHHLVAVGHSAGAGAV
jgi:hypothetical protein